MKRIIAIALCIGGLTLAAYAAEEKKPEAGTQDNFFKRAAKVIGHDAKTAAHQAGQAFSKTGKDIGHGASKTVKDVGQAMKDSAQKTSKDVKDTFK
jgi:hypothetical protein